MGVQMWLAQPERTRHGGSRFQHVADLPVAGLGTGDATVMVGGALSMSNDALSR